MKNNQVEALDFNDWMLPDEYLIELGRVAALWGVLEGQMDLYISKLAGYNINDNDPRGWIMVSHSTFPKKLDYISEFCEYLKTGFPHLANYEETVILLKAASKGRNLLFHNSFDYKPTESVLFLSLSRGPSRWTTKKVRKADIRRVAMNIHEAMLSLHALVTGVSYSPKWERSNSRQ